jgi:hypothetical protein
MKVINKYGLGRNIPEPIKREVRQRSKFGCVHCRCAIYEYEHIEPEFNDAKQHESDNICLLCAHCHGKVTKGILSKKTVRNDYLAVQSSKIVKPPFDDFDLNTNQIKVVLGSSIFHGAKTLIMMDNKVALAIEPPEQGVNFPTLSGFFTDETGKEIFRIEKNEWSGTSTGWDMTVVGGTITIKLKDKKVALKLRVEPPTTIIVEELDMRLGNSHLLLSNDILKVGRVSEIAEYYVGIGRFECSGAEIGVFVDTKNPPIPLYLGLEMIGGKGISLNGTGIRIGVGNYSSTIRDLYIEDTNLQRTIIDHFPLTHSVTGERKIFPSKLSSLQGRYY